MQRVTVITSARGGAGKSTVAAGLACALALRGEDVLLLDGNPLTGMDDRLLGGSFAPFHLGDAAAGRCEPEDAVSPCPAAGPGAVFLARTAPDPSFAPPEDLWQRWLAGFSARGGHLLVDLPWHSPWFPAASSSAHTVLVVAGADRLSADCCDRLRTSPRGRRLQNPRLVLNRFHRRQFEKDNEFEDLDQVIDGCGFQLMAVVPEDPLLRSHIPETMEQTRRFEAQPFRQKSYGGAIALHCLAGRLAGLRIPLRNLDRL